MNRLSVAVFVGVLGLCAAWIWLASTPAPRPAAAPSATVAPSAVLIVTTGADGLDAVLDAGVRLTAPAEGAGGGAPSADAASTVGAPDGGEVPDLEAAPKSVTFGVVLVTYQGAEGAPRKARTRAEALAVANKLAETATDDFAAAVKLGDPGSTEDAGKMFRGILERGPEYALFKLEPGAVGGPVDTPRGYWIVKRIK